MPCPAAAHRATGDDAADAGFLVLDAGRKAPGIGHQLIRGVSQQMHGVCVGSVHVLKRAGLLDNKNLSAQLKHGVQLGQAQRVKGGKTPADVAHAAVIRR